MSTVSTVIITKDEEANIKKCLNSVRWADEIIVVDTGSTDRTLQIAADSGARVYEIDWQGFGPSKRFGVSKASGEWILSVDADEEVTGALAAEIMKIISTDDGCSGYLIPRRTNFLGCWISHSRWYPDRVLRLFRKNKGDYSASLVHERVIIDGPVSRLKNPILHNSYPDIETCMRKFAHYSSLGAEELYKKGKKYRFSAMIFKPLAAICRHYITGAGFLDGVEGFLIASYTAFGVIAKYSRLRSLEKAGKNVKAHHVDSGLTS